MASEAIPMHTVMLEVLRGYLDGRLSAHGLMEWVITHLGRVIPSQDTPAVLLMGKMYWALVEFDEGKLSQESLRRRLAEVYENCTAPAVYDRKGRLRDQLC
jgi:hypothetical protein